MIFLGGLKFFVLAINSNFIFVIHQSRFGMCLKTTNSDFALRLGLCGIIYGIKKFFHIEVICKQKTKPKFWSL
jgi:hypothetical protein